MPDVYKALSSPVRRDILALLQNEDMTAGDVSAALEKAGTIISKPTLSGHFNILKSAGLIVADKKATTITYSINTSVVEDMMRQMMTLFGGPKKEGESSHVE
ncbi:metalloregulator ArsR/SmtB family transcription factor [Temperatibacter marinus]|uniref:Metalloregulator ArsR/SmtB family transcription factor n=1 Tax=Temperatibacter marinus TaxID=1456591 RepID=A0AA52EHZ8_9PROT|nr:metalloregulator ArsR/SmtB family transcription factor [Temperatibacter marinus]WND03988.1 metalloregulator ArsR/SmtB family transcription factor [Temperatibacter marinus]